MQNYKNYIIGGVAAVVIIGALFLFKTPSTNTEDKYRSGSNNVDLNAQATMTDETANIATTTNSTTTQTTNKNMQTEKKDTYTVKMETNKGTITLVLNTKIAPNTVENFVKLANSGFYNGIKFHRVIKDFMIQGGDPLTKDESKVDMWGTGGPGYKFADEITDPATYKAGYKRGILAMANSGPNTNGSQFFIMHKDVPLPPNYTIFGHVVSGLETVDAIANVKTGMADRPMEAVVINKVTVE